VHHWAPQTGTQSRDDSCWQVVLRLNLHGADVGGLHQLYLMAHASRLGQVAAQASIEVNSVHGKLSASCGQDSVVVVVVVVVETGVQASMAMQYCVGQN
jgi:hypothetical protein